MTTLLVKNGRVQLLAVAKQGPEGIQGPPGGTGFQATAGADIGGHRIVVLDSSNKAQYADCTDLGHAQRVVGMTLNAAVADDSVSLQNFGEVTEPTWNWDMTKPVYLGPNGVLTQVVPTVEYAKFSLVVGFPSSPKSLFVNIREPIFLN
jgi:hypothetical protein